MKWVNIKTGSDERYELWGDEKKLAGISFSTHTRIARVVSNVGKRLFFFEKKGILAHRTIIKNEYGIKMGEVEEEKNAAGMSHLELDGQHYYYTFNENNAGELKVYDGEMKKNILSCSFNAIAGGFAKTRSLLDTKFPSLLLVLCWYTFHAGEPVGSELAL